MEEEESVFENIKTEIEEEEDEEFEINPKNKLQQLQNNVSRLENAILLIAEWTKFDMQILERQGFDISNIEPTATSRKSPRQATKSSVKASTSTAAAESPEKTLRPRTRNNSSPEELKPRSVARKSTGRAPNSRQGEIAIKHPLELLELGSFIGDEPAADPDADYVPSDSGTIYMDSSGSESDPGFEIFDIKSEELLSDEPDPCVRIQTISPSLAKQYKVKLPKTKKGKGARKQKSRNPDDKVVIKSKGPYNCSECPEVFKTKIEFEKHFRYNHKVKTKKMYCCEYCGKTTVWRNKHFDHLRTHTGEKPFLCTLCGHMSRTKGSLFEHMKLHSDVKPFECDQCDQKFRREAELRMHKKKIHNVNNDLLSPCPTCKAVFSDPGKLKRHISDIHEEKRSLVCHLCGQGFKRREHLRKHIERHDNPNRRKRGPQKPMPRKLPPSEAEALLDLGSAEEQAVINVNNDNDFESEIATTSEKIEKESITSDLSDQVAGGAGQDDVDFPMEILGC